MASQAAERLVAGRFRIRARLQSCRSVVYLRSAEWTLVREARPFQTFAVASSAVPLAASLKSGFSPGGNSVYTLSETTLKLHFLRIGYPPELCFPSPTLAGRAVPSHFGNGLTFLP